MFKIDFKAGYGVPAFLTHDVEMTSEASLDPEIVGVGDCERDDRKKRERGNCGPM